MVSSINLATCKDAPPKYVLMIITALINVGSPMFQVLLHRVGQPCRGDRCLIEVPDEDFYAHVSRTKDNQLLTLNINSKTSSEVALRPSLSHS